MDNELEQFPRKQLLSNRDDTPTIAWTDWGKSRKVSVSVVGVPSEI
jgi:hypothetical protein